MSVSAVDGTVKLGQRVRISLHAIKKIGEKKKDKQGVNYCGNGGVNAEVWIDRGIDTTA